MARPTRPWNLLLATLLLATSTPASSAGTLPDPCATPDAALCAVSPPTTPEVQVRAWIGAPIGDGVVCTGTKTVVATTTAGGTYLLGLGEVTASVELATFTQFDFACEYHFLMQASGSEGFVRTVRAEANVNGVTGPPCTYDGITEGGCTTQEHSAHSGSTSGSGIAGPANGATPAFPLPTEITVCPGAGFQHAIGKNEGPQGLQPVTSTDPWECTVFPIHYSSSLADVAESVGLPGDGVVEGSTEVPEGEGRRVEVREGTGREG